MRSLSSRDDAVDVRREHGVDEQAPLTGLRVDADDGMAHRGHRRHPLAPALLEAVERPGRVVHGDQRIEVGAQAGGEGAIGGHEVGPQGVAAALRDLLGGQDRGHRRLGRERDVGVPAVVVARAVAAVADAQAVVLAVQHEDLGMLGVEAALQRMGRRELAEGPPEGDLLARRDVLIAQEHDPPAQQGRADVGDDLIRQRRGEVQAVEHGTGRPGQRLDGELSRRHPSSLCPTKRVGIATARSAQSSNWARIVSEPDLGAKPAQFCDGFAPRSPATGLARCCDPPSGQRPASSDLGAFRDDSRQRTHPDP